MKEGGNMRTVGFRGCKDGVDPTAQRH